MKKTVVGLITPHLLAIIDLAKMAESGTNVDWHLKDAVKKSVDDLIHQSNARDLILALIQGLESSAEDAGRMRQTYARALLAAAASARKNLEDHDREMG